MEYRFRALVQPYKSKNPEDFKMKRIKLGVVAVLLLVSAAPCLAVDFIVGAKAGYFAWEPYIKEIPASGFSDIDKGTGVLYGPVLSILFTPDITLSAAALTGTQSTYWNSRHSSFAAGDGSVQHLDADYSVESKRTDIDSALSYRIIENLKVFLGYKYQHIVTSMSYTEVRVNPPDADGHEHVSEVCLMDNKIETPSQGPALGIGTSYAFGSGYFAAANLSALYMRGYFKIRKDKDLRYFSNNDFIREYEAVPELKLDTKQIGLNFEPSIGHSTESGLIFTLGFRYQWLRTEFVDKIEGTSLGKTNDYLYGTFVSVLYSL